MPGKGGSPGSPWVSTDTAKVEIGACYQPAEWKSLLPTWPVLTPAWLGGWAFSVWPHEVEV